MASETSERVAEALHRADEARPFASFVGAEAQKGGKWVDVAAATRAYFAWLSNAAVAAALGAVAAKPRDGEGDAEASAARPWGAQHLDALKRGEPTPCLQSVHGDSEPCGRCVVCALAAARQEAETLRAQAKEDTEMYQAALRESDEMLTDFAAALGLPEKLSEHESPGYPHILDAIKSLRAALGAAHELLDFKARAFHEADHNDIHRDYATCPECADVRAALAASPTPPPPPWNASALRGKRVGNRTGGRPTIRRAGLRPPKNLAAMTTAIEAADGLEEIAAALRADRGTHPRVRWTLLLSFWNPAWETTMPDHCLRAISYHNTPSAVGSGRSAGEAGDPQGASGPTGAPGSTPDA